MKQTDRTLLEQMHVTELEIEFRKGLFSLGAADVEALVACRPSIERRIDVLVDTFYELQTSVPEIALLIGDADTLTRLRSAQRRYILDLFSGVYDLDYVNYRLRIGLVHKRIGVEPKLYLSAVHTLKELLFAAIGDGVADPAACSAGRRALERLLLFDVTLVFDTYVRSLLAEIETARLNTENYARGLEEKVRERTRMFEDQSRTDPLTGLLNVRHFHQTLTAMLRAAQRRGEPVTLVFLDVDGFKAINDTYGHPRGDEVLREVAAAIRAVARTEDHCFRYGGDEFCVALANCRGEQAREKFVTRLNERLGHNPGSVRLSVGVAQTGPSEFLDADSLIRQADEQMYAARRLARQADPAAG